jgi:hypothetical protein
MPLWPVMSYPEECNRKISRELKFLFNSSIASLSSLSWLWSVILEYMLLCWNNKSRKHYMLFIICPVSMEGADTKISMAGAPAKPSDLCLLTCEVSHLYHTGTESHLHAGTSGCLNRDMRVAFVLGAALWMQVLWSGSFLSAALPGRGSLSMYTDHHWKVVV